MAATEVFKLLGTIGIDNAEANRGIDETTEKAKGAASSIGESFGILGDGLISVGQTMSSVGKGLSKYVTAPIVGLGVSTAKTAVDFLSLKENTRTAFNVLLGGAEEAEQMLDDLYTFAKTTPFSYDGYLEAGKALVAMGVSAEDTIPYLDGITNAAIATGAGQEGINTLSNAIGTMSAKGVISLQELTQMTQMGIPAVRILANQYGVTELEMRSMISAGTVLSSEALPLLIEGMNEGTEGANEATAAYAGLAEESKNTLSGALDTLRARFRDMALGIWDAENAFPALTDVIRNFTGLLQYVPAIFSAVSSAAAPALETLNEKLLQLQEYLESADPATLEKVGTTILKLAAAGPILMVVGGAVTKLGKTFKGLEKIIKAIQGYGGIGGLMTKLSAVLGPIAAVIAIAAILVAALGGPQEAAEKLSAAFDWVREQVQKAADIIGEKFAPVLERLKDMFEQVLGIIGDVIETIAELVAAIFDSTEFWEILEAVIEDVVNMINVLLDVIQKIIDVVVAVVETIIEIVQNNMESIRGIIDGALNVISGIIRLVLAVIQGDWSGAWEAIKQIVTGILDVLKGTVSTAVNAIKTVVVNVFNALKTSVSNTWNKIKTAITDPIEKARDKVKDVIDKIKGYFNFEWSLPKLKMPHVSIAGEFSLAPPSVPKFSIDWYAKGGIMTEPTLFDYDPMSGRAKVGGEAGDEAIAPIDTLMGYVRQAVSEENNNLEYMLERLYNLLTEYLPAMADNAGHQIVLNDGTLVGALTPQIDRELGKTARRKR